MTTNHPLTRRERLQLAAAALRGFIAGFIAGTVHALLEWILNHAAN